MKEKRKIIGIVTERNTPVKIRPTGDYYALGEMEVYNPTSRIMMLAGKAVGDNSRRWRVMAKGPKCEVYIKVGDCVVLTDDMTGVGRFITGTVYKFVTEREIVAVLIEKESLIWDSAIEEDIAEMQAADKPESKIIN